MPRFTTHIAAACAAIVITLMSMQAITTVPTAQAVVFTTPALV